MNEVLDFIWRRRSVRAFTDEAVGDDRVRELLEAAAAAPSACCRDPWEFIVLRDRELLGRVAACLPNGSFLAAAPLGILVCGNLKLAHGESLSYLLQDCSAALENILLAAPALGLGGCWLGIHPREERIAALNRIFHFPDEIIPVGAVAIGVPAKLPPPRTRLKPGRIHYDHYGSDAGLH